MPYTGRNCAPELTPEEKDVKKALSAYSTADASGFDWVAVAELYRRYCDWRLRAYQKYDPDGYPLLTIRQFGRAVRRVFPKLNRLHRRSFQGVQLWGYAGLRGPDSIITPPAQGGRKLSAALVLTP